MSFPDVIGESRELSGPDCPVKPDNDKFGLYVFTYDLIGKLNAYMEKEVP